MTNFEIIRNERVGEQYYRLRHPSGLTIVVYPKKGYNSTYAAIGTNFGSVDTRFRHDGKEIIVPDGTAHYLEHKLFESEEGDAFSQYAKTGASANAYTSFDTTCYLFSCTSRFGESLEILFDLIQSPYFTPETVAKEQGIIGQEIKMYEDSAEWRVAMNLWQALYHRHPINIDIAGTVDTIAQITPEILYECYNSYYNLHNMVLGVAGNVSPEEVLEIADKKLKHSTPFHTETIFPDEPYEVKQNYTEQRLPVAVPLFCLGFKERTPQPIVTIREMICTNILLEAFSGFGSDLYRKLLDSKLINSTFSADYNEGKNYRCVMFEGESREPLKVSEMILEEVRKLKQNGISQEEFERARRCIYGSIISGFDSPSSIVSKMINNEFAGSSTFDSLEETVKLTCADVNERLQEQLDPDNYALSVIKGIDD